MTAPQGFDYLSPVPVYEQLAGWLRERIESGRYGPGRPLPSKRELRRQFGISGGTVDRAMGILRDEGLITTVKGKGLFVRAWDRGRDIGGGLLSVTLDAADMPPDPFGEELTGPP